MLIACKNCRRQYNVEGMTPGEHVRCRCDEMVLVPKKRPHEARMLHCSACGGKLASGTTSCQYCGSEVTLRDRDMGPACPECFGRLVGGARFCNECGIEIRPEAIRTTRASAKCPRCKCKLVLREFPSGHYTECTSCGGIWLDAESFDRVVTDKDTSALASLLPSSSVTRSVENASAKVSYIPCPVCNNLMNRKNYGGCSGVVLDWCKGHGFWFDSDELEKVIEFINSGGLDRSRQMEINRAKNEIDRLKAAKKSATLGSGPSWGSTPTRYSGCYAADWGVALGEVAARLFGLFR